ncbi:NAD(P)-dependent dehydrogenase (short-subunit alcohol dehydrogenase family) [Sphingomonas vulcanisoli]|uniref:NAD(P)-dependent dehydrogenase (Short-subunit alcohol dehydrogenase family) n=1 Tax=Sphingomonas vulcanisoli TaxID=1658060 RepID=A0ABX0TXB5_9SPHN|nr:SDR family oxidoreductase [Sphingomonas vulcanisoli]NIJ08809.1 NAD(P)-dependent dehydrogenase (short-subunit alcohol dehydrogenase family) [Sphingomonas vulcanisoli]
MSKIWFVTGASKGFGRIWSEAALKRGDKVAATARKPADVQDLAETYGDLVLPLTLDVTDRAAVFAAVEQANAHFGRIDVVVNNAGYGQFGMIEELSEDEARAQIETNLFGALWVLQAAVPVLRAQGSGHLLNVTSIGGLTAMANIGIYNASKWALEALSQSLAREVADFGVKVTAIEPAGYSTDWSGPSAAHATPIAAYEPLRALRNEQRAKMKAGDPHNTGDAILQIVDAENPPLRFFLGSTALQLIRRDYESRFADWEAWNELSAKSE